jgi:polynucleotide 5'-hydroxyl-kinase GRC3/NOL9
VGIYDFWVKRGVISLMGAKVPSSPNLSRVYAPSTHSLPVIKYVSGTEGYAEVEIRSCNTGISRLGELSPLFCGIWHSRKLVANEIPPWDGVWRTFLAV